MMRLFFRRLLCWTHDPIGDIGLAAMGGFRNPRASICRKCGKLLIKEGG